MPTDEDFERLFRDADVILVVDERKFERTEGEPEYLAARSFDRSTLPVYVYRALVALGAGTWHPSERSVSDSLFRANSYAPVMDLIEATGTCLYNHLFLDVAEYDDRTPAAENWRAIMASDRPGLGEVWKVRSSRHARALFWFVELVLRCVAPRLTPGSRVKVVLDRQDWLSDRRSLEAVDGMKHLGGRRDSIHADVLTIDDKTHPSVLPFLPLLGLVDSEAWALGRMLSSTSNGRRVHDILMDVKNGGSRDALHQIDAIFDATRANLPKLGDYLQRQFSWGKDKFVELSEGLSELDAASEDGP